MHYPTRKHFYARWAGNKESTRFFQRIWLVLLLAGLLVSCSDDDQPSAPDLQPPAPAGFRHANARVNGINLHYVTGGQGEPVVLLHGFPQTWYEWHRIMPQLGERYTVIAPDLRGGGLSDKPVPASGYDKKLLAEDIHQLVQQLGHSRVRLVGHDIGLMVAYAYASLYPGEVDQLVVLDAPLPGIEPIWSFINQDPRSEHFRAYQQPGKPAGRL
jgi:pimeloyl-ACP methyl ester carboxylesterase